MHMNHKNQPQVRRQGRFQSAVVATVLMLPFAASAGTEHNIALAQSSARNVKGSPAQVDGKLTIDGKRTELRHVYARRDWPDSALVDLIVTNQPASEGTLVEILERKYRGSDKLRGLWLIFDAKGACKGQRLLIQSGSVSAAGGVVVSMMNGDTKIENARIRGKLDAKMDSSERTTTFSVAFDSPVKVLSQETTSAATANPEQFRKEFESVIRGKWSIEKWRSSSGHSYTGNLSIDERLAGGKFKGTFHIADGALKVDEEVIVSREGTTVRMEGHVAPGTKWTPDTFALGLTNGVLVGASSDPSGTIGNVLLRKIP